MTKRHRESGGVHLSGGMAGGSMLGRGGGCHTGMIVFVPPSLGLCNSTRKTGILSFPCQCVGQVCWSFGARFVQTVDKLFIEFMIHFLTRI